MPNINEVVDSFEEEEERLEVVIERLEDKVADLERWNDRMHCELHTKIALEAREVWARCAAAASHRDMPIAGICIKHANDVADAFIKRFSHKEGES